ncbi:MAG: SidA/IucD/PvdA family monooxygenase [Solirubrobacteraceae bacterium]|nr:SidA/IucD/PvdA family monooxygenase [Solirubrobacteraceae bacterium]
MTTARDEPLDVVGVGIGPFNLGLAALLDGVPGVSARFFDRGPAFTWHPGLMLEDAEIQVPFLADLVTLADPTSPHTFLNYLHQHDRLYRFYFHERLHLLRREFQAYCRWVADRLTSCAFGHDVVAVTEGADGTWTVRARPVDADGAPTGPDVTVRARAVVLGTGTAPVVPDCAAPHVTGAGAVLHSAAYGDHRDALLAARSVTVVGSGQSAAEVFLDLLRHGRGDGRVDWFTRSSGFLAMEYSKLGLEHFTPEYTWHFHGLDPARRDDVRERQDLLYKGISADTSAEIYDLLYRRTVEDDDPRAGYRAGCELVALDPHDGRWRLQLRHADEDARAWHDTDAVVLATGYRAGRPPVTDLERIVEHDARGRPVVELDYRLRRRDGRPSTLFVQNAELHTHGVGTPDLGLGAHRNATIVNALLGRDVHRLPVRTVFQSFGLDGLSPVPAPADHPGDDA